MVDKPEQGTQTETPEAMAEGTPPPFSAFDHSFTLQAVMELHKSVGEIGGKIDGLSEKIGEQKIVIDNQSTRLDKLDNTISRVIGGSVVAVVLITAFGGFLWWLLGDALVGMRDSMLKPPAAIEAPVNKNEETRAKPKG